MVGIVRTKGLTHSPVMRNPLTRYLLSLLLAQPFWLEATSDRSEALNTRYLPHADRSGILSTELKSTGETWWRGPETIRSLRSSEGPLAGLHLALDPGHIGGAYAGKEGRHFRVHEADFFIVEGDLTLLVADLLRERLEALGARVTLLREDNSPVVTVDFEQQMKRVMTGEAFPVKNSLVALENFMARLSESYFHATFVRDELLARADCINRAIKPDAVLSLHFNAAPWPKDEAGREFIKLVPRDHCHVLIFGCMTPTELNSPSQLRRLRLKVTNGSGPIEAQLGAALGLALGRAFKLPPSQYRGKNAVAIREGSSYVWARNLLLLREIDCPVVLLEPFLTNSVGSYPRLQRALRDRATGKPLAEDDVLLLYAEAVVSALLAVYGTEATI